MSANGSIYAYTDQSGQRVFVKDTSLNFRGAWNGGASYVYKDVADYGSDQYIALVSSTGITPPTDISRTAYWSGLVLYQQGTTAGPDYPTSFLDLTDAPAAYGAPGDKLVVAQNGTTLAFAGPDSLLDLSDTPDAYGNPGDKLTVASNGTSLTFSNPQYFRGFHSFTPIQTGVNVYGAFQVFAQEGLGQSFNGTTGVFTCIIPGVYKFDSAMPFKVENSANYDGGIVENTLRLNGTQRLSTSQQNLIGSGIEVFTLNNSALVRLVPGDTVAIYTSIDFVPLIATDAISYERAITGFRL